MASVDLYAALQVPRGASNATIKQSFKKLALQFHPDKNPGSAAEAQELFQKVNEAYAILSDPEKRAFYDRATAFLNRGSSSGSEATGSSAFHQQQSSSQTNSNSQPFSRATPTQPRQGEHPNTRAQGSYYPDGPHDQNMPSYGRAVTKKLSVTLEEMFYGFHKKLKVSRKIEDMEGKVSTSSVILTVNGLPGWRSGTRVTFAEAGDKRFGVPAQDITIVIEEEPHALFQRRGDDLIMHIQIPLLNALYGHTEHIEAIDGKKINVPITRVTAGMLISLPGEGMPNSRGERGNLLFKYKIVVPTFAADSIRAVAALANGPTEWREVPMSCSACGELFRDINNADDSCFGHEGSLLTRRVVPASSEYQFVWSCCGRTEHALGCVCRGPHKASDTERSKARAEAAYNGLLAASLAGDVYAVAWFLLDTSVDMQITPIRAAVSNGHFLVTMLFVRDGADMSMLGGPMAALEMAAAQDKQLSTQLVEAMDSDSELFDLFASMPGAAQIVFSFGCRRGDTDLCQRLLLHPRVGPARCGVATDPLLANSLMLSCARVGDDRCLNVLLDAGVDVNAAEPETRRTALHYAAQYGHCAVIELLLMACARTSERDSQDLRPVDRAADGSHGECVVLLETAMLEEALLSMAGLSVLRLLHDTVSDESPTAAGSEARAADLRPSILIMEDALRNLCALSQNLSGCSIITGAVDPSTALEAYTEWREALGANDDVFTRNQAARSAVDALISAGVSIKASYQELLCSTNQSDLD